MGTVSPDSRWIAYTSDEAGTTEVYVQSFPTPGPKTRISSGGGRQPAWRHDGRELFYVADDRKLMAVPTALQPAFKPGPAQVLFQLPNIVNVSRQFAVSPDGLRFLALDLDPVRQQTRITLVTNWEAAQRP